MPEPNQVCKVPPGLSLPGLCLFTVYILGLIPPSSSVWLRVCTRACLALCSRVTVVAEWEAFLCMQAVILGLCTCPRRLPTPDYIKVCQRTMCVHAHGCLWRVLNVPPPVSLQRTSCSQRSWLLAWAMKGLCFFLVETRNSPSG